MSSVHVISFSPSFVFTSSASLLLLCSRDQLHFIFCVHVISFTPPSVFTWSASFYLLCSCDQLHSTFCVHVISFTLPCVSTWPSFFYIKFLPSIFCDYLCCFLDPSLFMWVAPVCVHVSYCVPPSTFMHPWALHIVFSCEMSPRW
jgi:hypothetical protein